MSAADAATSAVEAEAASPPEELGIPAALPPTPPVEAPPPAPAASAAPATAGGWLGNLFERPTLQEKKQLEASAPAGGKEKEQLDPRSAAMLAEQRVSLEQSALETVQDVLSQLRVPTLKQVLTDLGLPIDGGKEALAQRLTERLTLSFRAQ